jgi:hypothetical protein
MGLIEDLAERGWKVFQEGEQWVAERFASRPGATSSIVRVTGESKSALNDAAKLREQQLAGTEEDIKDTITNDGTLVSGPQHESLKTEGLAVLDAEKVSEPVPNEDEAKQSADFDATEGSVNAPQVPSDAADQGLSAEAVSASETGSGSADTSTDPSQNAEPATTPPPEGQAADSLPESDHAAVLAAAASEQE